MQRFRCVHVCVVRDGYEGGKKVGRVEVDEHVLCERDSGRLNECAAP